MNTDKTGPAASSGLGRVFELHECLGRGGFGEVYRATMVSPSGVRKTVAVKILREGLDPFGQAVERLRDEAHLLSALDHPAILKVHDLVILNGRVGLVTEYVDGVDLSALLRPENELSPRMLAECVADVASGLDAAWSTPGQDGQPMNLVHRDIKPANIRVSRHGQVKLLDFGIARANIEREASTTTDTLIGTYQYMAPERFGNITGPEGDVFALACVLFEGLSQGRFLNGLSLQAHYVTVASEDNYGPALDEQLEKLPEHVHESMRALLKRTLGFDRHERPDAAELAQLLEAEAPLLRGQSTRSWCREHIFPRSESSGELSGTRIAEGGALPDRSRPPPDPESMHPPENLGQSGRIVPDAGKKAIVTDPPSVETVDVPSRPISAARRRRGGTPWWVWLLLLLVLGALGAGIVSLFAGVLVGQSILPAGEVEDPDPSVKPIVPKPTTEPEPVVPEPMEPGPDAGTPDPKPVAEPEPVAEPVTQPEPVAPDPAVEPVPVEPEPVADPEPVVEPAPVSGSGLVKVSSPVPVQLIDTSGKSRKPRGRLPAGAYTIQADFGKGYVKAGQGTIRPDVMNTVTCKRLMRTCAIE